MYTKINFRTFKHPSNVIVGLFLIMASYGAI